MHDNAEDHKGPAADSWTLSAAKARLSEVVQRAIDGKPQRITRGGREAVVVLAEASFKSASAPRVSVVELFSALRGTGLQIERDSDTGREFDL